MCALASSASAAAGGTAASAVPLLSAILIVRDEERHIAACLASLRGLCDEVVVVDSGSTDRTVELATAAGARVSYRAFDGFGMQKQAALEAARGRWVLSIDADERITPALAAEIRAIVAADGDGAGGYEVRRALVYLGRRLRFGGTSSGYVLRLARREVAHFPPILIHEHLAVEGATRRLRAPMPHLKYHTLSEHLAQMDAYTTTIAARDVDRGRTFSGWRVLRIPWAIFWQLGPRLGILDGRAGIIHAAMGAMYGFLKSAKRWRVAGGVDSIAAEPSAAEPSAAEPSAAELPAADASETGA